MVMAPPCLAFGSIVSSARALAMPSISASADAATVVARTLFISCSLSLVVFLISSELDAGIDERRDDVGQEIAEHDGEGRDQRDAHDDRDVDTLDGLPGELADAGPAEHAFDDDDAAHEDADVDADHGDDRQ